MEVHDKLQTMPVEQSASSEKLLLEDSTEQKLQLPPSFICCICMNPMLDPVSVEFGHSYCRTCIQQWLNSGKRTNPRDGRRLSSTRLVDNIDLRQAVETVLRTQEPFRSLPSGSWPRVVDACLFKETTFSYPSRCSVDRPVTDSKCEAPAAAAGTANGSHEPDSYREGAERGDAASQFRMATDYALLDDEVTFIRWRKIAFNQPPSEIERAVAAFREGAEHFRAVEQHMLGWCYFLGWGVDKDRSVADKWFRKSADCGSAAGQFMMGVRYSARFFAKNKGKAAQWLRKSADQGYPRAQLMLGFCYCLGLGVPRDLEEQARWYKKAAEKGNARACSMVGVMYEVGSGFPFDLDEARRWYRKGADCGDHFALGACYENGWGVARDLKAAKREYLCATAEGFIFENCRTELQRNVFPRWGFKFVHSIASFWPMYPLGSQSSRWTPI
eukprot:TRINITY_DN15219_c0_g1_i4.p1 TRINITY_DN15219_c0_g1~~TRINITY_DN15219_c0_g1_i4.p1  ORF type:complete len:443 (+),score=53.60 TRINITY_DN15219_c0_g1_i4:1-1329(+)